MKKVLFISIFLLISAIASADEFVQMNNGMTCWRNDQGFMYGCSGGTNTGDSGFNEVETGRRYEYIDRHRAVDTQSGSTLETPTRQDRQYYYDSND